MIRHQAIRRQRYRFPLRALPQILQVRRPILLTEKYILPIIPALRHMMRHSGHYNPSLTCHDHTLQHKLDEKQSL
jgi:hypothetical protein